MNLPLRDKAIICGLFLAKFDREGLQRLGFSSFNEAFNVLGLAVGTKPASIKNYRDELDAVFPNSRRGWHQRPLRSHCAKIYDEYHRSDIDDLLSIVAHLAGISFEEEHSHVEGLGSPAHAKRLLTGRAAESHFVAHFRREPAFTGGHPVDVTHTGCGFDFRLKFLDLSRYFAIEVKGLSGLSGQLTLTEKEFAVANELRERYFLYVVKNLGFSPSALTIRDPIALNLIFKKHERKVTQVSWTTTI